MGARLMPPLAAFLFSVAFVLAPAVAAAAQEREAPAYLALGDSLAFGVGAENPAAEGYVGLTAFTLEQTVAFADRGLETVNVSAPGTTSSDLLDEDGQLDSALEEITARQDDDTRDNEVEIISINIGANDLLALGESDSPCVRDASSQACTQALSQMLRTLQDNLITVLTELRDAAPDARIYVMGLYNPYSGTDNPLEIIGDIGVQQVNGIVSAVAADETLDLHYASVYELFEGRGSQWIASDNIHPNNDGYRVLAEALIAAIQERPVNLPPDLSATASSTPTPDPGEADDGVDSLWLWVGLPIAFLAGAVLSTTFFLVRGR